MASSPVIQATTLSSTSVTVMSGQTYTLQSGVTATSADVKSGGELYVSTLAVADDAFVESGGTLALAPGSSAMADLASGSTLELAAGSGKSAGVLTAGNVGLPEFSGMLQVQSSADWTISGQIGTVSSATETVTTTTHVTTTISRTTVVLTSTVTATTVINDTVAPTLSNSGTLVLNGADIFAAVTGSGSITIGQASSVDVAGSIGNGQTIVFGANGGALELASPSLFRGELYNFIAGDGLIIDNFTATGVGTTAGGLLLSGTSNGTDVQYDFVLAGTPAGETFSYSNSGGSATITDNLPCYCRGTLILTARGDVPVEALAIGDTVVTASGEHRPIQWIGRRSYAGRFLAGNPGAQPIRFRAGSLGDGLPRRDLLVSAHHAMFLDGVLVPARCVVNGSTIVRDHVGQVDYYHVELATHDILLAEGAAFESFVDDDSRGMFHNAAEFGVLYPGAPQPAAFYAPRIESGFQLEAIRARLAARTAGSGRVA